MFISPIVQYAPVYVYNVMTILFLLKPDRSRDSQMNTKQQATFFHLCGNSIMTRPETKLHFDHDDSDVCFIVDQHS
jgi:hypothetical protein